MIFITADGIRIIRGFHQQYFQPAGDDLLHYPGWKMLLLPVIKYQRGQDTAQGYSRLRAAFAGSLSAFFNPKFQSLRQPGNGDNVRA